MAAPSFVFSSWLVLQPISPGFACGFTLGFGFWLWILVFGFWRAFPTASWPRLPLFCLINRTLTHTPTKSLQLTHTLTLAVGKLVYILVVSFWANLHSDFEESKPLMHRHKMSRKIPVRRKVVRKRCTTTGYQSQRLLELATRNRKRKPAESNPRSADWRLTTLTVSGRSSGTTDSEWIAGDAFSLRMPQTPNARRIPKPPGQDHQFQPELNKQRSQRQRRQGPGKRRARTSTRESERELQLTLSRRIYSGLWAMGKAFEIVIKIINIFFNFDTITFLIYFIFKCNLILVLCKNLHFLDLPLSFFLYPAVLIQLVGNFRAITGLNMPTVYIIYYILNK